MSRLVQGNERRGPLPILHQERRIIRRFRPESGASYADSVLRMESAYEAPDSGRGRRIDTPFFESVFRNALTPDGVGACFPT